MCDACAKDTVLTLDQARNKLEVIMQGQPSDMTEEKRKQYRAGYIDCLFDSKHITDDVRGRLYIEYGP